MKKFLVVFLMLFTFFSCSSEGSSELNPNVNVDRFFEGKYTVLSYNFSHDLNNKIFCTFFWEYNGDIVNATVPLTSVRFCYDESATTEYIKFKYYYNSIKNTSLIQDTIDKCMIYVVICTNKNIKSIVSEIK